MKKRCLITAMVFLMLVLGLVGCKPAEAPKLTFYIGSTMVKPVSYLADEFKESHDCEIEIVKGPSQTLYDDLKQKQVGDLYMPGSYSYRKKNLEDGLLLDAALVGYNKAALMVAEGNPLNLTNDLEQLTDPEYDVVFCNPESGSIGKESKKILESFGIYEDVVLKAVDITTDSTKLTESIKDGSADICLNWYATAVWDENKDNMDAITIDEQYAAKKELIMNLLSFSENPELTKEFIEFASSDHGKDIFEQFGFIEKADRSGMDSVEFE